MTAARFHGRPVVVEGNWRPFALKAAGAKLGPPLRVCVEIVDLHLGVVRSQERLSLASRAFWCRDGMRMWSC